jgi:urease accessory protein UreE
MARARRPTPTGRYGRAPARDAEASRGRAWPPGRAVTHRAMTEGTRPAEIVVVALASPADAAALAALEPDPVLLTAEERRWPRRRVTSEGGRVLILALPSGEALRPGDVLHVGAGWYAVLAAAPEPVLAVAPRTLGEGLRVAHAVGNQHALLALDGERLLVPDEPAMERLMRRLDVPCGRARLAFVPRSFGTPH